MLTCDVAGSPAARLSSRRHAAGAHLQTPAVRARPAECGLALGVPLSRQAFVADLARGPEYDLAATIRRLSPVGLADAWRKLEQKVDSVRWVAGRAEEAGVEVIWEAGIKELRQLLSTRRVVTLLAHTRPAPLTASAILDRHRLAAVLDASADPVARLVRRVARARSGPPIWRPIALVTALEQLSSLAEHQVEHRPAPPELQDLALGADVSPASLTRAALETSLPGLIQPAPVLELRDGLHPVADLIEAIPDGFDGVLDLSLFRSAFLAGAVARARPETHLLVDMDRASLPVRMARYRVAVDVLSRYPSPFSELIDAVHRALAGGRF